MIEKSWEWNIWWCRTGCDKLFAVGIKMDDEYNVVQVKGGADSLKRLSCPECGNNHLALGGTIEEKNKGLISGLEPEDEIEKIEVNND